MEFFTSPENFRALEPKLKAAPSITYMAVNAKGEMISNVGPTDVNAVTWGVFPAKEIIQPTVVDPQSFAVWKVSGVPFSGGMKRSQLRLHRYSVHLAAAADVWWQKFGYCIPSADDFSQLR